LGPVPTLQQLTTLVAISRHGSVARAAEAMEMTASPVSRTLRQLERALGPLFDRGYHDMRLNDVGARVLPVAVSIVQQAADLGVIARGGQPALRYAATPWVPARFARELAACVEATGPAQDVDAAVSAVLLHRMRHGEIDVALVHLPAESDDIATLPLARYRFHLAVSASDPIARQDMVGDQDLLGRRVLLLPSAMHPETMQALRRWFEQRGVGAIHEVALGDVPSLAARLRREHAVTIVAPDPESPILRSCEVRTVPFEDGPDGLTLGIAWRSRDAARAERLRQVAESLRRPDGEVTTIGG
jgi:DNA-binding transcriptional LysR family regulator